MRRTWSCVPFARSVAPLPPPHTLATPPRPATCEWLDMRVFSFIEKLALGEDPDDIGRHHAALRVAVVSAKRQACDVGWGHGAGG